MSKIAPWPWVWDGPVWDYEPENEAPWLLDAEGHPVLQGEIQCMEHHARLIAAAPELLAALKAAKQYLENNVGKGYGNPLRIVNKAIAKASPPGDGESPGG